MAGMNVLPANPMWKRDGLRKLVQLHRVLEPTADPLLDRDVMVQLESVKVAAPHGTRRVVSPPDLGVGIGCELQRAVNKLHGL